MILIGEERRSSGIRPESIDLKTNKWAILAMIQAAEQYGDSLSYDDLATSRPDIRSDFLGKHRDLLRGRGLSQEEFEATLLHLTAGAAVDLRMKPEDREMHSRLYDLRQMGLRSFDLTGNDVLSGTYLGTLMLQNSEGDPDPDKLYGLPRVYRNVELDIDLHSLGSAIMRGHVDTHHGAPTDFWSALHFDELTPLEPDIRHEIIYEPLGTRQVTALASYVLERMPA